MISRRMVLLGLACAPLAACGRKMAPKAPEGSTFPRPYPDIDSADRKAGVVLPRQYPDIDPLENQTEPTGSQGQSR